MKDRKKKYFLENVCVQIVFLENKVSLKIVLKYFLMGVVIHTSKIILEYIGKKSHTATFDLERL